ncbi:MAG: hypothetical protein HQL72_10170 [Magnetococcales bacterium]|nr:hypothetical protein [Magnetococcales bacterium]
MDCDGNRVKRWFGAPLMVGVAFFCLLFSPFLGGAEGVPHPKRRFQPSKQIPDQPVDLYRIGPIAPSLRPKDPLFFQQVSPPQPIKPKKRSFYDKVMDSQPTLKEWVAPYIDTGGGPPKGVVIKLNTSRPEETALNVRPFHNLKGYMPGFDKLEIRKPLAGNLGDLKACYQINDDTSAEIVQEEGSSAFLLNYSSSF